MSEENGGSKEEEVVEDELEEEAAEDEAEEGAESEEAEPEEENGEEEYEQIGESKPEPPPLWRRALNWSKAAKGWATVISIVGAMALGFYGTALKKAPEAVAAKAQSTETWKVLNTQVNTLAKRVNTLSTVNDELQGVVRKLSMRVVFLQAHEAGFRHGATHEKMMQLQRENEALRKKRGLPTAAGATVAVTVNCKNGFIEVGGRCRKVSRAVATEVMKAKTDAMLSKMKAATEERRRKEAEAAGLSRQSAAQKPAAKIRLLPRSLGAAKKMLKKQKDKLEMNEL